MVSDSFGPSAKGLQTFIGGGYGIGHTASSAGLSEGGAERLGLLPPLLAYSPQFNDAERDVRSGRVDLNHRPPGSEVGNINGLRAWFIENTRLMRRPFGPYLDPKRRSCGEPDPAFHVGNPRYSLPAACDPSSEVNISSIGCPKSAAILNASERLGSYLPVSMALTVWRETPNFSANSACDKSCRARRTRSSFVTDTAVIRGRANLPVPVRAR